MAEDNGGKHLHDCRWARPPVSKHSDWWEKIPQEYKEIEGQQWSVSIFHNDFVLIVLAVPGWALVV